ncbi:D-alanyl-D-alanine carboxypeptidase [Spirillospora sp. NPDC047418]
MQDSGGTPVRGRPQDGVRREPWRGAVPQDAAGAPARERPQEVVRREEWRAAAAQEAAGTPVRERPQEVAPREAWAGQDASVTRVERLPGAQGSGEFPASRSSGQWSVPWDGGARQAPPRPVQPAEPPAEKKGRRGRRGLIVLVAALVLVVGVVAGQLIRPVPEPMIESTLASGHAFPGQAPALSWPAAGQSAVYVEGLGMMGSSGGTAPTPTASVAKVMTAFVYLRDHPLKPGEPGPVLTVSPEAAAQIPMRRKREESLLGVTANQRLTQRKALEALLIISANDVAHELARWDAGNEQAFVAKMNATAAELGMAGTHYTDPSGYDSGTVSTAQDQVKLLRAAMRVPAFTEVVNHRMYVPDNGGAAREGGNFLLGQHGVVGGKTGYTDAAGGNFVFAARKTVAGVQTLIIGAVMGQKSPSSAGAVSAAGRLVTSAEGALTAVTLAPKGAQVARVDDGLGGTTPLRAAAPVTVVGWSGLTVPVGVTGDAPHRGGAGERVGAVTTGAATVPLQLGRTLDEPSYLKRLIRIN